MIHVIKFLVSVRDIAVAIKEHCSYSLIGGKIEWRVEWTI